MPPLKSKIKKQLVDNRTSEEILIQSSMTSYYNILIPGYNAQHIRIKNPLTGKDSFFSVKNVEFFEMFYELSKLGLKNKLMKELQTFILDIDPNWQSVYDEIEGYFKLKDSLFETIITPE